MAVDKRRLNVCRARIARAAYQLRQHPGDVEAARELDEARAAYVDAKLEEHIRAIVAQAPPLTDEQRTRLTALLADPDGAEPAA